MLKLKVIAAPVKDQQHGAGHAKAVAAKYGAPNVYWLRFALPAGKKGAVKVRAKAKLTACPALAGTTLAFGGLVYQTDATTGNMTCATPATISKGVTQVKALGESKAKTPPSPAACPTPAPPDRPT
jgi:hypothetical protein